VRLRVPGEHNVANSLAVLAAANCLQVPFSTVTQALRQFRGMRRRFEIKGVAQGITVVDDYAHHPTEIRATLAAARTNYPNQERQIWAVWQPHTYSRTHTLLADFARCFGDADHVLVTPIYAARERNDLGIQHTDVVAQMAHRDARAVADFDEAVEMLARDVRSGDVVLTLGAGDGDQIGERLLTLLHEREKDRGYGH
jgi:UDP-N-acetylmuramate--alanine ligase